MADQQRSCVYSRALFRSESQRHGCEGC